MSIRVSVVVPTYKRPRLLRNCLNALIKQNFSADGYEIIIVDDGCSEETRSLVEEFSGDTNRLKTGSEADSSPRISYAVTTLSQGPAAARNLGWRMARGSVIAFTDDDCLPEPDWLKEGVAALEANMAAVSGRMIVPISDCPTDYEKNIARLSHAEFVTANCFCHRWALEAIGGFDERFETAWREDSDLQFKMLRLSFQLGRALNAKVIHPVRPAPWGVSIKEQRKSMFDALLYKKYPDLYRQRIKPSFPVRYYGILSSLLGSILALITGNRQIAFSLFLLWVCMTLQFTLHRLRHTKHTLGHILEMLFTSIVIPPLSVFWRLVGAVYYRVLFF